MPVHIPFNYPMAIIGLGNKLAHKILVFIVVFFLSCHNKNQNDLLNQTPLTDYMRQRCAISQNGHTEIQKLSSLNADS